MVRSGLGLGLGLLAFIAVACGSSGSEAPETGDDAEITGAGASPEVRAAADACSAAVDAIPPATWLPERHVDASQDAAVAHAARTCLSSYVQLRTVNPAGPGDVGEVAAAGFFKRIFEHLGMPTQTAPLAGTPDPNRVSLVATLPGRTRDKSVLLLNHTDVVPATGNWTHPPFSGEDDGAFIWGRGSLDMKSIGIMQMLSMAILKRSGAVLEHDVHFAAVPDEEVGGRGSEFLALGRIKEDGTNEHVDPLGLHPGVVLNEGGTGIRDALLPGRDFFVIGSEEKGVVWTQMAHASPTTLIRALARTSVLSAPKSDGIASSSDRDALKAKCRVAAMISDESQKTNVQPRLSKVTLDCEAGSEAIVRRALEPLPKSFKTAPKVTITSKPQAARESIEIAIEMGSGGHGSASVGATALDVAVTVLISAGQLDRSVLTADSGVADRLFPLGLSPANQTLFSTVARSQGETAQSIADWVTSKPGLSGTLLGLADGLLPTDAPFKNTCNWTAFKFPADGEARAKLDCRLTFDTKANDLEGSLATIVRADGVVLRTNQAACFDCYKQEFNSSPTDTPQYHVIEQALLKSTPNAVASAYLFPGSSDTFFFRRAGVPTFGFMPASVGEAELHTFHAIDERIPIAVLAPSVRVYAEVVEKLANGSPAPAATLDRRIKRPALSCRPRKGSGSSFRWGDAEDRVQCEGSLYLCTRASNAPRFVEGVPDENDAEVSVLARMRDGYDPNGSDATEMPSAVEARLFEPRGDNVRVFAGQPFEIDTGAGSSRSFLVQCTTPLHQRLATFFTRSKVSFFSE